MSSSRRKSSKSSATEDDKKQRGRPRVEPQDETPQDRRRTQIRLAQRAYRQRKEVTITALRQRATELKGVVSQMNDSFAALQNAAFAAGVETTYPMLANQMRSTSTEFGLLVQTADQGIDEILDGEAPGTGIGTGLPHSKRHSEDDSGNSSVDGGSGSKRPRHESTPPLEQYDTGLSSMWGYSVMPPQPHDGVGSQQMQGFMLDRGQHLNQGTADSSRNALIPSPGERSRRVTALGAQEPSHSTRANSDSTDKPRERPANPSGRTTSDRPARPLTPSSASPVATTVTTKNPVGPFTLAHADTTFARRLHRICLERAYYAISHNLIKPDVFRSNFRMSLLYGTQDQLKAKLRLMLKRDTSESLEWEDHPMIMLGGAGTHYPLRDADGNIVARPNAYAIAPVNDNTDALGRRVRLIKQAEPDTDEGRNRMALAARRDIVVDITGYEGEWFDPGDVEGYLREKGVDIKAQNDFVDGEVDEVSISPSTTDDPFFSNLLPEFGTIPSTKPATTIESPPILAADHYLFPSSDEATTPDNSQNFANDLSWTWPGESDLSLPTPPPLDIDPYTADNRDIDMGDADAFQDAQTFEFPTANNEPSAELLSNISRRHFMEKRRITLDVRSFINELSKRGVCLGRTPGFRRKDVDRAFNVATAAF